MDTQTIPPLDKPLALEFETKAANTIRMVAADGVQAANSGHPGMPMGMAAAALTLWTRVMRYNPANPQWLDRDRFVLSAGHGSMLLYTMLHLTGYDLPLEELKRFRQWGSKTPGHPEAGHTAGVETTTGPLGAGFSNGVGMALAERWLAQRFNRPGFEVVNHFTYAIVSDGDLMEGVASEAASLAGHLHLGKLIYLYDDNSITIDGKTDVSYTEDWAKRFDGYGWHVQRGVDFNNSAAIYEAVMTAQSDPRPSIIGLKSIIGFGSPNKAGTSKVHGEALGEDELKATKEHLGWPQEPRFYIPEDALAYYRQALARGELPDGWEEALPVYPPSPKGDATRNTSGKAINALAAVLPNLIGGSADLAASNKTTISGAPFIKPDDFGGPNIHFGVREHGMGGILNGMALHGGVIPYGGTFMVFSDYMRGAIRLAAISGLRVVYVFTHDSIGLGEDGPTHQSIEHAASLRLIPNLDVWRPCDVVEAAIAWATALENDTRPSAMLLSRQNVPYMHKDDASLIARGGYVLAEPSRVELDDDAAQAVIIATGSEVQLAMQAQEELAQRGIAVRVVSMPSTTVFDRQTPDYKTTVLPPELPRIAVEMGSSDFWWKYGCAAVVGIDTFGESAPAKDLFAHFGFTPKNVADTVQEVLNRA